MTSSHETGRYLKKIREEQNVKLEDVAASINVRRGQLRAIEDGNLSGMPAKIYVIGFVKAYANYLGLDAEAVANDFKLEHYADTTPRHSANVDEKPQNQRLLENHDGNDNRVPTVPLIVLAVIGIIICLILWRVLTPDSSGERASLQRIPDAPVLAQNEEKTTLSQSDALTTITEDYTQATPTKARNTGGEENIDSASLAKSPSVAVSAAPDQGETVQVAPSPPTTVPKNPAAPDLKNKQKNAVSQAKSRIRLHSVADSWVKVTDRNGRALLQNVMRPGDEYWVPDQPGLTMITGNAGGLEIYVDGRKTAPLGGAGDIIRGVELTPQSLTAQRRPRISPRR